MSLEDDAVLWYPGRQAPFFSAWQQQGIRGARLAWPCKRRQQSLINYFWQPFLHECNFLHVQKNVLKRHTMPLWHHGSRVCLRVLELKLAEAVRLSCHKQNFENQHYNKRFILPHNNVRRSWWCRYIVATGIVISGLDCTNSFMPMPPSQFLFSIAIETEPSKATKQDSFPQ